MQYHQGSILVKARMPSQRRVVQRQPKPKENKSRLPNPSKNTPPLPPHDRHVRVAKVQSGMSIEAVCITAPGLATYPGRLDVDDYPLNPKHNTVHYGIVHCTIVYHGVL